MTDLDPTMHAHDGGGAQHLKRYIQHPPIAAADSFIQLTQRHSRFVLDNWFCRRLLMEAVIPDRMLKDTSTTQCVL